MAQSGTSHVTAKTAVRQLSIRSPPPHTGAIQKPAKRENPPLPPLRHKAENKPPIPPQPPPPPQCGETGLPMPHCSLTSRQVQSMVSGEIGWPGRRPGNSHSPG